MTECFLSWPTDQANATDAQLARLVYNGHDLSTTRTTGVHCARHAQQRADQEALGARQRALGA